MATFPLPVLGQGEGRFDMDRAVRFESAASYARVNCGVRTAWVTDAAIGCVDAEGTARNTASTQSAGEPPCLKQARTMETIRRVSALDWASSRVEKGPVSPKTGGVCCWCCWCCCWSCCWSKCCWSWRGLARGPPEE